MAKSVRRLNVEMSLGTAQISKDVRQVNSILTKELGRINTKINIGIALAGAVAATAAVRGLVSSLQQMADAGENAADIRDQFSALGGSAVQIDRARDATLGLIDSFELMQIANKGMIRDIPGYNENFGKMAELSQRLAAALGIDTKEALDKVTAALASGKQKQLEAVRLWGDSEQAVKKYQEAHNLVGSELTKTQKKIAIQEEAIRQLDSAINSLGQDTDSAATAYSAFNVQIGEAYKEMGIGIDSSQELTAAWRELSVTIEGVDWESLGQSIGQVMGIVLNFATDALPAAIKMLKEFALGLDVIAGKSRIAKINELGKEADELKEKLTTRDIIGGRWETFGKRQADIDAWAARLEVVNKRMRELYEEEMLEQKGRDKSIESGVAAAEARNRLLDSNNAKKGEAALKKEAEAAKKAREEQEKLTQAWQKRINSLETDIMQDALDLSISSRDAEEFAKLVEEYRATLHRVIGEELTKEFGKEWPKGAEQYREIMVNRGIMPVTKKWQDEMDRANKEIADKAAKEYEDAVSFWKDAFQNAITGEMFNLEDSMKRMGVGFAAAIAAGITGGMGEGVKSLEDLGQKLGEIVLTNVFDAKINPKTNKPELPEGSGYGAGALMTVLATASAASNIEEKNKKKNTEAGTGAAAGTAIGGTIGTIIAPGVGTAIGASIGNVIGELVGGLISKGFNADSEARHIFAGWMEDQLQQYFTFAMKDASGNLQMLKGEGFNFFQGTSNLFSTTNTSGADWAGEMSKWGDKAFSTFLGLGEALEEVAGISENVGGELAYLLGTQLSGNIDNARMLVQMLGVSLEDMMAGLETAALQGEMRWAEYNVAVQGVNEAYKEGLVAFGDYSGALDDLTDSGGRGIQAVVSFRNIAIEAMEAGITSIDQLRERLIAEGADPEWVTSLITSVQNAGIKTLQEWADASNTSAGTIVGNMEAVSASIREQWTQMSEKIDELNAKLAELPETIPIKIKVSVEDPDGGLGLANKEIKAQGGANGMVVPFKSGGVVSSPTFFKFANGAKLGLMGEAGPEAILPLKKVNGRLGVYADLDGGSSRNVVINVDARGAGRGAESDILDALRGMEERIVSRAVSAIVDGNSRGYW